MTGGNVIPKGYERGQLSQFTPEQMQLFQHSFSQAGPDSYLGRLSRGDPGSFEQLEAPAHRQFQEKLGEIGSRFAEYSPGAMSASKGSGFRHTVNQAASDFAQQLQSQRMGLQMQAIRDLQGLSESLLNQRPYEHFLIKKQRQQSGLAKAAGIGLPILGAAAGAFFGGPAGAAVGGQLGSAAASGFSRKD
jgi:hypothetical protein